MTFATDNNESKTQQGNVIPISEGMREGESVRDSASRKDITNLVDALINPKLKYLCKKYCSDNRYHYKCTIDSHWGCNNRDTPFCEWGNATYLWMLEDLTNEARLQSFQKNNGRHFDKYVRTVVNSLPFFERYKDWRFCKKVRVPDYIKVIDEHASRIFWGLCDEEPIANIAQRLNRTECDIKNIAEEIQFELAKRRKTYLLNTTKCNTKCSYEDEDNTHQEYQLAGFDVPEDAVEKQRVMAAYNDLSWQEQYLIECIVIDNLNVKSVLKTLTEENITLIEGKRASEIKEQQIYYLLRKAIYNLSVKLNN